MQHWNMDEPGLEHLQISLQINIFMILKLVFFTWAMNTTCFPLNFFSSSRTSRTWIFWKDFSWGTGTKIMMAFLPPPTSISWKRSAKQTLAGGWEVKFGLTVNPLSTSIGSLASDSVEQGEHESNTCLNALQTKHWTETLIRALVSLWKSDWAINPTTPFRITCSELQSPFLLQDESQMLEL